MRQIKISSSITNRNEDSLGIYLREISKTELLSLTEELHLVNRMKNGDVAARDKLVVSNLRFAVSVAKKYVTAQLRLPDLINVANMGMIYATISFDETRGFKFISYAVWWMRHYLQDYRENHMRHIRLPGSQLAIISRIKKAREEQEQHLEREPTDEEIAAYTGIRIEKIRDLSLSDLQVYSLDSPNNEEELSCLLDVLPDENGLPSDHLACDYSFSAVVSRCMKRFMDPRIQLVLKHLFGLDGCEEKSIDAVADMLGLSGERIRQLKYKGILMIRSDLGIGAKHVN